MGFSIYTTRKVRWISACCISALAALTFSQGTAFGVECAELPALEVKDSVSIPVDLATASSNTDTDYGDLVTLPDESGEYIGDLGLDQNESAESPVREDGMEEEFEPSNNSEPDGSSSDPEEVEVEASIKDNSQSNDDRKQSSGLDPEESPDSEGLEIPEKVENGAYTIESALGTYIDVSNASTDNWANVQTYSNNYTSAQRFHIDAIGQVDTGEWFYTIKNVNSGKVLDCANGGKAPQTNVQQFQANGTGAQNWFLRKTVDSKGRESYSIINVASGLALDVAWGNKGNGANVQVFTSNGTAAQMWYLCKCIAVIEDGAYVIESQLGGGLVVDVASGSGDDRAALQVYRANGTLAQDFALNYDVQTGYYTITSYGSGKVADVANGSAAQGTPIHQYGANGTKAQQWHVLKNADGTVTFVSALSGQALDVTSALARSGTRLQQYGINGTNAQRFMLKAATPTFAGGLVSIRNGSNTYLVMDVQNGSKHSGAVVQLYGNNGTFAQKFQISADKDGGFTVASIVSGLLVSASESGAITQQAKDSAYVQRWSIVATDDGHFAFVAYDDARAMGVSGAARQGALLAALAGAPRLSSSWNMVLVPLIEDGLYAIAASLNQGCVLDIAAANLRWGGNAQIYGSNGTNAQKFYVRNLGSGQYSITNIWSALALDVANGAASVGANIQQYGWNGTSAQRWQAVWDGSGGVVFKSLLGNLALGMSNASSGSNAHLVAFDASKANQRFVLTSTAMAALSVADRIAVLDTLGGAGLDVFKTMSGVSQQTRNDLYGAIRAFEQSGHGVGFMMIDLTTGAGVSYNPDRKFYSASTIKGPYVAAVNEQRPWLLSSYSNSMWSTINYSDNNGYAYLRSSIGPDPIGNLVNETHAYGFNWRSNYADISSRDLAKLWIGVSNYLVGNQANADWCRNVFGTNGYITSRPALSWKNCAVYAKSGWMYGGMQVHNEACLVMDGNRPYVMAVMTQETIANSWKMANLMNALDRAHAEIVR